MGDEEYHSAAISSDGKRLAAYAYPSLTVALWDLENGIRLENVVFAWTPEVASKFPALTTWHEESLRDIAFVDGSRRLFVRMDAGAGPEHPELRFNDLVLWDLQGNKEVHRLSFGFGNEDGSLTPDGQRLLITRRKKEIPTKAAQGPAHEVAILNWETGETSATIPLVPGHSAKLKLSPDGKRGQSRGVEGICSFSMSMGRAL